MDEEHNFITNSTIHRRLHHYTGVPLFRIQFHHVVLPLTFGLWLCLTSVSKTVLHRAQRLQKIIPESGELIILGLVFGAAHYFLFPEEACLELYLHPDLFFLVLVPPIALDAGYSLHIGEFIRNIGAIVTYAVFATVFNTVGIAALLCVFKSYYPSTVSVMNVVQFATLISAVDPVAVISVFEEMHVNRVLYICVFGESLLNDAVSVVLYHTTNIMSEVGLDNLRGVDYITAFASFFTVSLGGILIGFVAALLTALLTKYSEKSSTSAIVGCFIFPYMAYIVAEALGLSGMLAIIVCGAVMKMFVQCNLAENAEVTFQYALKTLSSCSEAVIFIFLGVSAVSRNHEVCIVFILVAIVSCLICRFAGVYLLTYLINRRRTVKISLVDQFVMAYGGIRGAVCYGLVMSLDTDVVPCRNMLTTTVVVVVLFTVFVQGGTIKYFVRWLHVAIAEERHKNMVDMVMGKSIDHMMAAVEGIAGVRGYHLLQEKLVRVVDAIKPYLTTYDDRHETELVKQCEAEQVKEAVVFLRHHTSSAGLAERGLETDDASKRPNGDAYLALHVEDDAISRDVSLRSLVRERFAAAEAVGSKRRYSRHAIESIEPTLRTLIPLLSPRAPPWSIDTTRSNYVTARPFQELVDPSSMKSPNPSIDSEH